MKVFCSPYAVNSKRAPIPAQVCRPSGLRGRGCRASLPVVSESPEELHGTKLYLLGFHWQYTLRYKLFLIIN